jgi:hypothetical protein
MNRSILVERLQDVKAAERQAERELDAKYRPAVPMKHPRAEKGKLYLTNGTVVTPRPGVHPGPITQGDVQKAAAYCPGVKLSDTPLAFGPFKGLTFGRVRGLRAGDRLPNSEAVVTSDTEGVRYLDRLLSEPWVYEVTKTRLALYLKNSNVQKELLQALGPVVRDGEGGVWPAGGLDAGLCFPPYGDGGDGSLKPDDFSVTGTPTFDPTTGRDSWSGGSFEEGPWKGQGQAKWLRSGNGTAPDSDPTPGNWRLDDPVRFERDATDEEDSWVDMKEPADNDVYWDWKPELPLNESRAWQLGIDYVQRLERLGGCSHQTPGEARDALGETTAELKRRLGLFEGKFRWHPAVAESLRKAIAEAVQGAQDRISAWLAETEQEAQARAEEAQARRVARLSWRGLDSLGRRKRVSKKQLARLQEARKAVGV